MAINPNSDAALEVSQQVEYMRLLKEAPIAEFAKYLGGDFEKASQLRVDEAIKATQQKMGISYNNMDIAVRPIEPQGNLYGFASVNIGAIKIDDFKIVKNSEGELFVGMPSRPDKRSETGYRNTVSVDKDYRYDFNQEVINAYNTAVEKAQTRSERTTQATDKPSRVAEQVAQAKKSADKHNADLPPAEKKTKARGARGE